MYCAGLFDRADGSDADGRAAVTGRRVTEFVHPEQHDLVPSRLDRVLEDRETVPSTELRFVGSDGAERHAVVAAAPVAHEGDPAGQVVVKDITERKRAERELERQNERLEELVSVVAHDLRNPLNVARGYAEVAQEEVESDAVEQILTAHERMEQIVDDLLTLARQGERISDPEPVDLQGVATRAWETVRTTDAELRVAGTRRVMADGSRLRELLENLFRNAVEHGSTSGRAQSDAEHGATDPAVTVELGLLEDGEGFYVADDGPGIPPEHRDRVFQSGFTTAEDGTGFGLPIVRRIAEAHGWTVEVAESETGEARFEVGGVEETSSSG